MRFYDETNQDAGANTWLKAYVEHQRFSESPTQFHFWSGVSAIAGALRRRVWIDQRHFQWTPNMYIVLVGPPGVAAKSTSMKGGLSLLEAVEGVAFGPQSMTWQALIAAFKRSLQTITIIGSEQPVSMSCLTVGVSELGNFLDPQDRALVDFLTDIWDSHPGIWRREIKKEGLIELHNPWLNLIACTTPAWLAKNFPEDLVGGGLTSRIVFVYGARKEQIVSYPSEQITSEDYETERKYLLHDLTEISQIAGEYKLTPSAIEWGDQWNRKFQNGGLPAHLTNSRFEGYVARKQSHVHKLAMVFAASKRSTLAVTREDLVEAEEKATKLEVEMLKVFESIGVAPQARITNNVIKMIENYKKIDYRSLWQLCHKTIAQRDFKESIDSAINAGLVKKEELDGKNWSLTYIGGKR